MTRPGQSVSLSDRPAYDIVVQAMSGMTSINGPLGGPATRVGFSVGDIAASELGQHTAEILAELGLA